jgi:diguanylate cyclase (GGDEF)-like protein
MTASGNPERPALAPVRHGFFLWLTDPGQNVPANIRQILLGRLLTSPAVFLMGALNAILVSGYAVAFLHKTVFLVFILIDLLGSAIVCYTAFAAARGRLIHTDLYLLGGAGWCLQLGCLAFLAMLSDVPSLQLLAATLAMGLMGVASICQSAAPRWALFLVALIEIPLVTGAALTGTNWGAILVIQAPAYLFASFLLIRRFQGLAVTSLIARQESLHNAHHDTLTGVLNRAGFGQAMATIVHPAATGFVMFYLDLDGFKTVNDSLGPGAGDRLLADVAGRIKAFLRSTDLIARLGSDEFLIVAHGMPSSEAANFAHALTRCVTDPPYDLGGSIPVSIGLSIGFACYPDDGDNPAILQSMADTALYEAKAAGPGTALRFRPRRGDVPD